MVRFLKALVVLIFLALTSVTVFVIYAQSADDFEVKALSVAGDANHLVLLFHGSGDHENPVWKEISTQFDMMGEGVDVIFYDWREPANNRPRVWRNGEFLGEELGRMVSGLESLDEITLVAHSAGATVLDPLCERVRKERNTKIFIRMVFLDAYGGRGLGNPSYGVENYGACADFALAYININDPVPTTNDPLQNAFNLDVTLSEKYERDPRGSHYWPLNYYLGELRSKADMFASDSHDEWPRGEVKVVN